MAKMKIKWSYVDGTNKEEEASEEIGICIQNSRREEANGDRKQRAHNYSLDAIVYEGKEYGREDKYPCMDDSAEKAGRVRRAFRRLTKKQQQRLWWYVIREMSLRKIAKLEKVSVESVSESVDAAKRNFKKFYEEHEKPRKTP